MENEVCTGEASWVASPAWVASQVAMEAEAFAWLEANRESLRADLDAECRAKDDGWDDGWVEDSSQSWEADSSTPPSPSLDDPVSLPLLSHLAQQVPADMSGLSLVQGLGAWQRFTGFSTSRMWIYLGELHARFTTPARARLDRALATGDKDACEKAADLCDLAERSVVAEVACELSWSQLRAQGQVEVALILTTDLVKTLDAVAAGLIEVKKAETIARGLARETSELRARVEDEILPHAGGWTIPTLNGRIREAVLRLAPERAADRARWARKQRGVSFHAEPDDMMRMEARMPVEDGIRVQAALDQATATLNVSRLPGDDRGMHEIRCDILTGALSTLTATGSTTGAGDAPGPLGQPSSAANPASAPAPENPDKPGSDEIITRERARRVKSALRSEIVLTVPLETITGDADHPGYLARYGPVSAGIARALALDVARDGYWRCAVTDTTHGTLLGLGRSTFSPTYRAPEFLQRFTTLRDQTCDFPTCTIPAAACDFDHTIPWPQGTTCECGGGKRCRNHHRLKHETGWKVRTSADPGDAPGAVIWTSPTGREHTSQPPSIGIPRPTGASAGSSKMSDPTTRDSVPDSWAYTCSGLPDLPVPRVPRSTVHHEDSPPPPF